MATFLMFDEGVAEVANNGLPATVYFLLSSRTVAAGEHLASHTLAGGVGEVTYWTGGGRLSQSEPSVGGDRDVDFAQMSWQTGAQTDGPAAVKSVVAVTSPDNTGKAIAAWDLSQTRAMNLANATLNATPVLGPFANPA